MYKNGDKCIACEKGALIKKVITEHFEYENNQLSVPNYEIFECNLCGEAFVSSKTIRATEKTLTDFRRSIDGLLTSAEIKTIRKKLGLTQTAMAEIINVGKKTFARYENGQVTQGKAMDLLLRMIDNAPHILSQIKIKLPKTMSYKILEEPSAECTAIYDMTESDLEAVKYKTKWREYRGAA